MPRLLVDISAHGYGHLAQTAPVLAALARRRPDIELMVRSALPREVLERRIGPSFQHILGASDFGFVMRNAVDIDHAASAARYREFHADWEAKLAREAVVLRQLQVDLLLANAAYLPLAGAAAAGIPALGMCSLNWADLFAAQYGSEPWAAEIEAQMLSAYASAGAFLRATPGMPMSRLANLRPIGPIARVADPDRRAAARARLALALDLPPASKWGLVAMGGMDFRLPLDGWAEHAGVFWICPREWQMVRRDLRAYDEAMLAGVGLAFFDLLSTVDVVLTKPGYGTFAEAVCNGQPLVYVPRDDWPEEAPLVAWAKEHGRIAPLPRSALGGFDPLPMLAALWATVAPPRPEPNGAAQAAAILDAMLPTMPRSESQPWRDGG